MEAWVIFVGGWLFLIVIWIVLTFYDLYAMVVKDWMYVVDEMNLDCWGLLLTLIKYKINRYRRHMEKVRGLMVKDGTYIMAGVMVGGGKWYLQWFRYGVVECRLIFFFFVEVFYGLCVWVEVWEKVLVLMLTFWKKIRFFLFSKVFWDG